MLRILSRLIGVWLMATALVAAVVDGAKSIAASRLVLTPLQETWATIAALGRVAPEAPAEPASWPWPLDLALAGLQAAPTVVVLALLSLLFLAAGRRRRPLLGRDFAT